MIIGYGVAGLILLDMRNDSSLASAPLLWPVLHTVPHHHLGFALSTPVLTLRNPYRFLRARTAGSRVQILRDIRVFWMIAR